MSESSPAERDVRDENSSPAPSPAQHNPNEHDPADHAPSEPVTEFSDLDLAQPLAAAIADLGFTSPSPIQSQAIPPLLAGRDVIGVAQTGTGKTLAFGVPTLTVIDPEQHSVQAIVLAPTRELAIQVADAMTSYTSHLPGVEVVAVYGGSPYGPQERALERGAQVVVGTPGRVMDHLRRRTLTLDAVRIAVLDEADEMLRMGFAEDVEEILSHTPAGRQIALFSATMPPAIRKVATTHMHEPVQVSVAPAASTVDSVRQTYAVVPYKHRIGALARILAISDAQAAIVFVRTRATAEEVGTGLIARGINAATISGDVPQKERERIVARLRDGSTNVLVATDVAARGLDVDRIGLVVNFDVPREAETYVHRVGRTGRAGRTGDAITLIGGHERRRLRAIERATAQRLDEAAIPSPRDVSQHRLQQLLASVPERIDAGRLQLYREHITELISAHELDPIEVAAALAAQLVGDPGPGSAQDHDDDLDGSFDVRADGSEDASPKRRDRRERGERSHEDERSSGRERKHRHADERDSKRDRARDRSERSPAPESGYTQYRINVGHKESVRPGAIVGALTGEGGITGDDVGKIAIFPSFSLVQIHGSLTPKQLSALAKTRVNGRELRIREDTGPGQNRRPDSDGKNRFRSGKREDRYAAKKRWKNDRSASGRSGRSDRW